MNVVLTDRYYEYQHVCRVFRWPASYIKDEEGLSLVAYLPGGPRTVLNSWLTLWCVQPPASHTFHCANMHTPPSHSYACLCCLTSTRPRLFPCPACLWNNLRKAHCWVTSLGLISTRPLKTVVLFKVCQPLFSLTISRYIHASVSERSQAGSFTVFTHSVPFSQTQCSFVGIENRHLHRQRHCEINKYWIKINIYR